MRLCSPLTACLPSLLQPVGCDYVTPGCLNATHWANLYNFGRAAQAGGSVD
jgi:hypothetical protein